MPTPQINSSDDSVIVKIGDFNRLQGEYVVEGAPDQTVSQRTPISKKNDRRQLGDIDFYEEFVQAELDWVAFQQAMLTTTKIHVPYDTDWFTANDGCIDSGSMGDMLIWDDDIELEIKSSDFGAYTVEFENGVEFFVTHSNTIYRVLAGDIQPFLRSDLDTILFSNIGIPQNETGSFKVCATQTGFAMYNQHKIPFEAAAALSNLFDLFQTSAVITIPAAPESAAPAPSVGVPEATTPAAPAATPTPEPEAAAAPAVKSTKKPTVAPGQAVKKAQNPAPTSQPAQKSESATSVPPGLEAFFGK